MRYFFCFLLAGIVSVAGCGRTTIEPDAVVYEDLNTLEDARQFMKLFEYQTDSRRDYPNINEVFDNNFVGDCKTASVMAKWALGQIGIPARIIVMYYHKGEDSHAITVSNDNTLMVDGHLFGHLPEGADWVSAALSFNGNYEYLIDGKIALH